MNDDVLREEIEDLRLFADPFEGFSASPNGGGWTATFVRKGEEIAIRRDAGGTIRTLRGSEQRTYRGLKSLLVGEAFANLARLAWAQLHATRKLADATTGELKDSLPNAGRIECGVGDPAELTFDGVCDGSRTSGYRTIRRILTTRLGVVPGWPPRKAFSGIGALLRIYLVGDQNVFETINVRSDLRMRLLVFCPQVFDLPVKVCIRVFDLVFHSPP